MEFHGADGIPRQGREVEYATQLWLDGPSAFWLHPEGPLSETTPDEWLAKRAEEDRRRREAEAQNPLAAYARLGLLQNSAGCMAYQQSAMLNARNMAGLQTGLSSMLGASTNRLFGGLF